MAYMSQEKKAKIQPKVKTILNKYGLKGSLSVRHHSTLVLTIKQGSIDFIKNYNDRVAERDPTGNRDLRLAEKSLSVNCHWYKDHFTGRALKCIDELVLAMNDGNHDRSDLHTDYFDVGWYVDINIGQWNQPYALVK